VNEAELGHDTRRGDRGKQESEGSEGNYFSGQLGACGRGNKVMHGKQMLLSFLRPREAPYKVYPPKFQIFALKGAKISG
jgi:hypothetical protein